MPDESVLEGNGNGHGDSDEEIRQGATIPLEMLEHEDGFLARAVSSAGRNNSGVLQRAIAAIEVSKDYRQELKTGNYSSPRKALQAADAIHECLECGMSIDQVVDEIIALKAGVNSALLHEVFQALTHTSFSTNYQGGASGKGKDNGRKNSPIT